MTEVDKKNNEIILEYLSRFSLKDESFEKIKSIFASPDIDPIYAKHLGPDLRKRWIVDYEVLENQGLIENKGFEIFNGVFSFYQVKALENGFPKITIKDFSENKVLYKKNSVKLKKVLVDFYNSDKAFLKAQWYGEHTNLGLPSKTMQDFLEDATLAEQYVIKANEYVGRFKISKKASITELVMSNNPADWIMCSTKEEWTSCLSLESTHGYWAGLPFILDDKNRTMFYITSNGRKKEFLNIKVDGFNNRSWGLLESGNSIATIRWFPDSFLNLESMRSITGLPLIGTEKFKTSKYSILTDIHFSDGTAQTPYLDNIGVAATITGEVRYQNRAGTGFNSFVIEGKAIKHSKAHITSNGFEEFIKSNRPWFKFLYSYVCKSCNQDINTRSPFIYNSNYYCDSCRVEHFYTCYSCGNEHLKGSETEVSEGKLVCNYCFELRYDKCKICGKIHEKAELKNGFCKECILSSKEIIKCSNEECGNLLLKKEGIHYHSDELGEIVACSSSCSIIIKEIFFKEKKISYFACPHCSEYHDERDGVVQYNGKNWCRKCTWKIADKKQMKFVFKMTA